MFNTGLLGILRSPRTIENRPFLSWSHGRCTLPSVWKSSLLFLDRSRHWQHFSVYKFAKMWFHVHHVSIPELRTSEMVALMRSFIISAAEMMSRPYHPVPLQLWSCYQHPQQDVCSPHVSVCVCAERTSRPDDPICSEIPTDTAMQCPFPDTREPW